jgi:hypothetical protein
MKTPKEALLALTDSLDELESESSKPFEAATGKGE